MEAFRAIFMSGLFLCGLLAMLIMAGKPPSGGAAA